MRRARAFTLLEVVVALAILGVSLVAILQISAQAVNSHLYAKKLTVATLLARSKMIDLEQELYDKPLPADDTEDSGDFSDDGWPSFKWRSKVVVPKTNGLTPEQLFGALFNLPLGAMGGGKDGQAGPGGLLSALFGASGGAGGAGGLAGLAGGLGAAAGAPGGAGGPQAQGTSPLLAALGPMAGMASQQFTQMVDVLQKSVREVHLTVSWKEGKTTESIDLVTHVVSMGLGSDRNGGGQAGSGGASGGWVRADNGTPVANPAPGPNGAGMVDPTDGSPLVTQEQWAATHPAAGGLNPMGVTPMLNPTGVGLTPRNPRGSRFMGE